MHQCRWWHKIIQSIDSVSHISCHYLITAPQTIYFVNGWNMRVGVNCNIWLSWWESYYKGELTVTLIDFPVTLVFNFWKFRTLSLTTVLPCRTTQDIKSHYSHLMITVGIKAQVKQKYVSVPRYVYLPILEPVFDGKSLNQNAFNWPLCVVMKENPKISSQ